MSERKSLDDWLAYIERQHPKSIAMGLDRVRDVATRMALRQPAKKVVTVAGTNGKGSTVAFIEAIARAAGWRVGAYTSPHLLAYNERVRIDGRDATDADLVAGFSAVEAARGGIQLTYFEYGTLCALWLFQCSKLDLVILEVGLGGRLDAVNLIDADVAVITTVDLDHQDWLGNDREAIGLEKAGIARAGKPLVLGEDDPPSSVLGRAYAIGASAIRANCDFFFETIPVGGMTSAAGEEKHWRWREVGWQVELPLPRLAAPVQLRNAATAIAALRALRKPLPRAAIAQGVAAAQIAGRLQRFVCDGIEIVLDVAHNPQAARELGAWLQRTPIAGRTLAVFAALADKDLHGLVAALAQHVDAWLLAGIDDAGPRGLSAPALAQRLAGSPAAAGAALPTVDDALRAARGQAQPGDRILVFGSFHTVAAALPVLDDSR